MSTLLPFIPLILCLDWALRGSLELLFARWVIARRRIRANNRIARKLARQGHKIPASFGPVVIHPRELSRLRVWATSKACLGFIGLLSLHFTLGYNPILRENSTGVPRLSRIVRGLGDDYLEKHQGIGLVIVAVRDSEEIVMGFGKSSLKSDRPPDGDTFFELGSITKTFTGILLAQSVQEGTIRLDDPVQKNLPPGVELPLNLRTNLLIKHLTTHSSGFPRLPPNLANFRMDVDDFLGWDPYRVYSETSWLEAIKDVQINDEPGAVASYSNFGTSLLGYILAKQQNCTYEDLVRRQVLAPLGMNETRVKVEASKGKRLAQGYRTSLQIGRFTLGLESEHFAMPDYIAGAGGLVSTGNEMLRYLKANMGKLENPISSAMELSHQRLFDCGDGFSLGMNWILAEREADQPALILHDGGTGGFRSLILFTEDRRVGVVILSNFTNPVDKLGVRIVEALEHGLPPLGDPQTDRPQE